MTDSNRRPEPRRFKIFTEPAKAEMTSHWDLDYITHSEYEQLSACRDNCARTGRSWVDKMKSLFTSQ